MKWIVFIGLIAQSPLRAQQPMPFKEAFYLISSKCSATIVEMNSGELKTVPGDGFSAICDPLKGKSEYKCSYVYNDKSEKPKIMTYLGGIIGSEALLTVKNIEQFNINMVTKKFQSDSYIYVDNGRIRGNKICSGDFIYSTDADRILKKKK
jgi:hypothetical protein